MTEKKTSTFLKTICIDFDGVLHAYDTKWSNAATISDGPVSGAMDFLKLLHDTEDFAIAIYSSRSSDVLGKAAMMEWVDKYLRERFEESVAVEISNAISWPTSKPAAWLTIDDRALLFEGTFPTLEFLRTFKPWNKRPADEPQVLSAGQLRASIAATHSWIQAVARETGCPDGTNPLDWLEERARIGHAVATTAEVTIERISDEDMERLQAMSLEPGAIVPLPPSYWSLSEGRLRSLLETAWDLGAGTAYARRDRPDAYEADGKSDAVIRRLDVGRVIEKARKDGVAAGRPNVDGVPVLSADELPVPERMSRHAAARGKTVDEVLADTDVRKVYRPDGETEEVWTFDAARPLSFVTTRQDPFHVSDEAGETRQPDGVSLVEIMRQRQARLDAQFAHHADVEAIIIAAVPPGTPVSRASAAGELGWHVGFGWMAARGTDASKPDEIRDFARSLAEIPAAPGEKPRQGDPKLVERTLAAGRAH